MSLIQLQKLLTFEDICPKHSLLLAQWDKLTLKEKRKESKILRNPKQCFLGEAHVGKDYDCSECLNYADVIIGLPSALNFDNLSIDWEIFEELKTDFVEHWNMCHHT